MEVWLASYCVLFLLLILSLPNLLNFPAPMIDLVLYSWADHINSLHGCDLSLGNTQVFEQVIVIKVFIVLKVFEPVKFDCISPQILGVSWFC